MMLKILLSAAGDKIMELLTSKEAIITYVAIILLIILVLVAIVILNEQRRVQEIKYKTELGTEAISEETLEKIERAIERKFDRLTNLPYMGAPVYVEEKKSKKKADDIYTYGYARYSILGALFTTIILFISSIWF